MNTNIDPQEIAKFDKIANDWWNPQGKMKPLHQLNPLRLNYVKKYLDLKNKKVIDVGCGGGILSESLAKERAIVTAIDLSESAIEVAKQHAKSHNLNIAYQHINAEEIAKQQTGQYDAVTCMEMLEHVPDPEQIVNACAKLLKPGGYAFFSTIHRNPKAYLYAVIGAEYFLNLLPRGTHEYAKFIRPSELDHWANSSNLSLLNISGIQYSIFERSFFLGADTSVNYLCSFKKVL